MTTVLTAPTEVDLTVYKGNDYTKTFEIETSSGVALDLTNYTVKSQIRTRQRRNAGLVVEFTATIDSPATDGEVTITLTDTQTAAVARSTGHWDLLLTDAAAFDEIYVYGKVTFKPTVTVKP